MLELNKINLVFAKYKVKGKVISEKIGKLKGTISSWRNNKSQPSLLSLYELADAANIEPAEFLLSLQEYREMKQKENASNKEMDI